MKNKKAKAKTSTILIVILALLIVGFIVGKTGIIYSISGNEQMTRSISTTQILPSSTFTITYTAIGTSGTWGASIVDNVAGGCKFPDGTNQLKTVMLSSDGLTKTITMTAPASGSCIFTGDYKYGTSPTLNFAPLTVTICSPTCTRPSNLCTEASAVSDTCGGYCTGSWTVTKNTNADTNCNNIVDRTELGVYINSWISGSVTRDALGQAIVAWIGTA